MDRSTEESVPLGSELMMDDSKDIYQDTTMPSVSSVTDHTGGETPNPQTGPDETVFQAPAGKPADKHPELINNEDKAMIDFQSLNFPKKLWKIIESEDFSSMWWHDDGITTVIDPQLFPSEVLGRKGSSKIFETTRMETFIRQLNIYGFVKVRLEYERSPSLPQFLAEEEKAAAFEKLLFFKNPYFRRGHPLHRVKRKPRIKKVISDTSTSEDNRRDNPRRQRPADESTGSQQNPPKRQRRGGGS